MTYLHALILGIVEGITEFLPISSTGHLIVAGKILKLPDSEFLKTFEISIQLGAILSVVVLYWRRFFMSWKSLQRIVVAFIPTAVLGLAAYSFIKKYLLGNVTVVLWSLATGGVILIIFEKWIARRARFTETRRTSEESGSASSKRSELTNNTLTNLENLPLKKAASIGLCQSIAFIPGVSRSGATIVGGMLMGISRATIVEFSFLLAVPTMAAATGLDLIKNASLFSQSDFGVLAIGLITSFVVAIIAIKLLVKFVQKHTFVGFGVYRIVFSGLVAAYLFT